MTTADRGNRRLGDRLTGQDQEGVAGHLRNALQVAINWTALIESSEAREDGDGTWLPENNGASITEALQGILSRTCRAELAWFADTPGARLERTDGPIIADKLSLARSEALYALRSWRTMAARPQGPRRSQTQSLFTGVTRRLQDALREVEA